MGNERSDRTGVHGTAQRAGQIVDRRLERAAHADLGQDHGGEHRPPMGRLSSCAAAKVTTAAVVLLRGTPVCARGGMPSERTYARTLQL